MKTFVPAVHFTGFPDGKTPVNFRKGQESVPVSDEFAQLMFDKGLAEPPVRKPAHINPPKSAVAKKIAAATGKRRTGKAARSGSASKG